MDDKIIKINRCGDCPNELWQHCFHPSIESEYISSKLNLDDIPSWCPLPDYDDPLWDCTDFAHPSWWRAHDYTANKFCELVNKILDDEPNSGGISSEPWESTRKRLYELVSKKKYKQSEDFST